MLLLLTLHPAALWLELQPNWGHYKHGKIFSSQLLLLLTNGYWLQKQMSYIGWSNCFLHEFSFHHLLLLLEFNFGVQNSILTKHSSRLSTSISSSRVLEVDCLKMKPFLPLLYSCGALATWFSCTVPQILVTLFKIMNAELISNLNTGIRCHHLVELTDWIVTYHHLCFATRLWWGAFHY